MARDERPPGDADHQHVRIVDVARAVSRRHRAGILERLADAFEPLLPQGGVTPGRDDVVAVAAHVGDV